jgi:hypothetical protein
LQKPFSGPFHAWTEIAFVVILFSFFESQDLKLQWIMTPRKPVDETGPEQETYELSPDPRLSFSQTLACRFHPALILSGYISQAENIKTTLEWEMLFYSKVFGFTPADPIKPLHIDNM